METVVYRTIDFGGCKYIYDIHETIKKSLALPDFYGRNLDALWDSLTGLMETPAHITIRGIAKLPKDLQPFIEEMLIIFFRAQAEFGDEITVIVES